MNLFDEPESYGEVGIFNMKIYFFFEGSANFW